MSEAGPDEPPERAEAPSIGSEERTWAVLAHAGGFLGILVPFGNILGPLLIWAIKKDEHPFVAANGRNAVNFQVTWTIILIVAALSVFVLIGFILVPLVMLAWLIFVVIAIVRASENEVYEYPLTIDFIED